MERKTESSAEKKATGEVEKETSQIIKPEVLPDGNMQDETLEGCQCCHKTKERSPAEYKALLNRLSRIEGQIRGIRGMVERDAYCTDILMQVSAVTAALNAFNKELLGNHIRTCVARDIREGRDGTIDELVSTLQKLMR